MTHAQPDSLGSRRDFVDFSMERIAVAVCVCALVFYSLMSLAFVAFCHAAPESMDRAISVAGYASSFLIGGICYRLAIEIRQGWVANR